MTVIKSKVDPWLPKGKIMRFEVSFHDAPDGWSYRRATDVKAEEVTSELEWERRDGMQMVQYAKRSENDQVTQT